MVGPEAPTYGGWMILPYLCSHGIKYVRLFVDSGNCYPRGFHIYASQKSEIETGMKKLLPVTIVFVIWAAVVCIAACVNMNHGTFIGILVGSTFWMVFFFMRRYRQRK